MKAIQLVQVGSTESLKYVDVACPVPEPSQVLIRVHAASVNFADIMIRKGTYSNMPILPAVLGLDCSGVIETVGSGVTKVKPGQRVVALGLGCYADYMVTEEDWVFPISEGVDSNEGAAFPVTYLTAYHLLSTMGNVKPGQTILVYAAAGGVGSAVGQLSQTLDIKTIGLVSSDTKRQFALEQGYHDVINYKKNDLPVEVMRLTEGQGVDFILNSVGGETLGRDFDLLAPFGQILWFGNAGGSPPSDLIASWQGNLGKSGGIRFFSLMTLLSDSSHLLETSMNTLREKLECGHIKPVIHKSLPLCEASKAHEALETGDVQGKLLLHP